MSSTCDSDSWGYYKVYAMVQFILEWGDGGNCVIRSPRGVANI